MTSPPTVTLTKCTGVSAVAVSAGGTGYVVGDQITIAGGTFLTAAVIQVVTVSGGVVTGASVARTGVYTSGSVPANPAAQGSTTGSGTGATFTLTFNVGVASSIAGSVIFAAPATTTRFRFTGSGPSNISSSGYYGNTANNGVACLWEWTTDAVQLDILTAGLNTQGTLYVDGVRVNNTGFTTDASGQPYTYTVAFGGSPVVRTYKLFMINSMFGGINIPGVASVWIPAHARRPLAWILGDSYTYGTNAALCSTAGVALMCELLGIEPIPDGIGGTGWNSTSANDPATRVARLTSLNRVSEVKYVFLDLGYNDAGGNMTTLATNFAATVAAVRLAAPLATVIAFGPATPLGNTTNLGLVKTAVAAQCAALGIPFVDVQDWVSATNKSLYTAGDNVHPTQAGYDFIAGRRAQAVSALV
jgi:lysophospholipase L1-like esterase